MNKALKGRNVSAKGNALENIHSPFSLQPCKGGINSAFVRERNSPFIAPFQGLKKMMVACFPVPDGRDSLLHLTPLGSVPGSD